MTFIGFHTEILPEEGPDKRPEFWNKEYAGKYERVFRTGFAETAQEKAVLANMVGMYGLCLMREGRFDYWIAGKYRGGEVPEGFDTVTLPASRYACFTEKAPMPEAIAKVNEFVMACWLPGEGLAEGADANTMIEVYSPGNPMAPDYEFGLLIPVSPAER